MKILLVEDEGPKREHILAMLKRSWPQVEVDVARSVRSAVSALRTTTPNLVLLDMSLTTFDVEAGEPGGRPQGFGGIEVLRYLERFHSPVPVVVVTAYEAFSVEGKEIGLEGLSTMLKTEHPNNYVGLVYFNSLFGDWGKALEEMIEPLIPKGTR